MRRLIRQTLADPSGLTAEERRALQGHGRPRTIRAFDDVITAPRWGFADVEAYYNACSPWPRLRQAMDRLPPLLLVHANDDPWVSVEALSAFAVDLAALQASGNTGPWPEVMVTDRGGHNGFHAPGDSEAGCWSDRLAALWLRQVLVSSAAN